MRCRPPFELPQPTEAHPHATPDTAVEARVGAAACNPGGASRRVALRLRALSVPSAIAATDDLGLWSLLAAGAPGDRRLTVAVLLRRGLAVEVDLALDCRGDDPPPGKRTLEHLARAALPGCLPVAPSFHQLAGPALPLAAPPRCLPATRASAPSPGATPASPVPTVLLPLQSSLRLDPGRALVTLAQLGIEADLVLALERQSLGAARLRRLAGVGEALAARSHASTLMFDAARRQEAERVAIEAWRAETEAVVVAASVRLGRDVDADLAAAVAAALFGATSSQPVPDALDLSTALRPDEPRPALVPPPAALAAAGMLAAARARRAPRREALRLGADEAGRTVALPSADLAQHLFILGATGSGKSSLLRSLVLQAAAQGMPHIVFDPHGDLAAELAGELPAAVRARMLVADATDFDRPFTLNILEVRGPHAAIRRSYIANQLIQLFKLVYGANPEAFGPIFEIYWRASVMLLMAAGGEDASLTNLDRLFGDKAYRDDLLARCDDPQLIGFWKHVANRGTGEIALEAVAPYIVSKATQIAGNPILRPILCAPSSSVDLDACLDEGRTVLFNLGRGILGAPDAALLGGVLSIRLFAAAMARGRLPLAARRPVRVVMDEFPGYASTVLGEAMAEVRKFGLQFVLANQGLDQIDGRGADIAHAILANAASICAFRVGPGDAARVAEILGEPALARNLMQLPNGQCIARLMQGGVPQSPRRVDCWAPGG